MSAATQDLQIERRAIQNAVQSSLPVAAASKIYGSTFVGKNGNVFRGLVAGDEFSGLARQQADNTSGAAADISVPVETGLQIRRNVTGATGAGDRGKLVYATDDNTLTLTAAGGSLCGAIDEYLSGTECWIHLFTPAELAAAK